MARHTQSEQPSPQTPRVCSPLTPEQDFEDCTYCAYRTPVFLFALCMAIIAAAGYGVLRYVESKFIESAGQNLTTSAVNVSHQLDLLFKERYGDIQMMARAKDFRDRDRKAMTAYMQWIVETYPAYTWIGVTDETGRMIAATDSEKVGQDRSDRDWFQSVRDHRGIHIQKPQTSPDSDGAMAIAFTAPIYGPTGNFIGAVTSRASMLALEDSFVQAVTTLQTQWGTGTHLEYQFISPAGDIITDSMLREEGHVNLIQRGLPSAQLVNSSPPGYIQEQHLRRNNIDVITGYAASKGIDDQDTLRFGVLLRADREDIVAPIQRTSFIISLAAVAMVLPLSGLLIVNLARLTTSVHSARREHERAAAAETKFRHIINSSPDAMVIVDSASTIVLNNPQAESLFGHQPDNLLGQPLDMLLPERFRTRHRAHNQDFFDHPSTRPMGTGLTLSARRLDGSEFPTEISLSYMSTKEGRFAIASIRDVTQQKQRERELEAAKVEALSSTKVKSEFLASMSHEIRTPLNAIIGMSDLLWGTTLSSEQRKYLRVFRRAGDTLLNLINDILDLSKIEAGHMELDSVAFNLEDVIDKVMEMLTMQANDKGLEFASHIDPAVPRHLVGDPMRLTQILINLLGNALKFTEQGSVTLQVANDDHSRMPGTICFTVSDTGIGIPPDKLEIIFERFRQVDASRTRQYGGTGLGLAISKHLAERMHGRIEVDSTVGKGSVFRCTVSLGIQSPDNAQRLLPAIDLTGIRTLIVDDHPINRLILREMLAECRADITEAVDGPSALRALREAAEQGRRFELLLLDCRMPAMDGFQTVDRAKQSSLDRGLTIVMLTSDDWASDIARTYDLSLGGYLIKPLRRADLIKVIGIALRRSKEAALPTQQSPAPPTPAMPVHSLRILLAEDSPDNQLLIRAYLLDTNYQLDMVNDGAQAVEQFKHSRYDVILMDMQMPVMDGFAATQAIRKWEEERQLPPIPIVALTALALMEEAAKSLKAGCTIHLTKPIRKQTLLDLLQQTSTKLAA